MTASSLALEAELCTQTRTVVVLWYVPCSPLRYRYLEIRYLGRVVALQSTEYRRQFLPTTLACAVVTQTPTSIVVILPLQGDTHPRLLTRKTVPPDRVASWPPKSRLLRRVTRPFDLCEISSLSRARACTGACTEYLRLLQQPKPRSQAGTYMMIHTVLYLSSPLEPTVHRCRPQQCILILAVRKPSFITVPAGLVLLHLAGQDSSSSHSRVFGPTTQGRSAVRWAICF